MHRDRLFWVCLSRLWKDWRDALIIIKPDTVIKWHREGFRLYWRWKSKTPIGRPPIDIEIRELIRRISRENPLWGVPRIQSELRLLGFNVTEKTVAKYRVKRAKPPSQTWKTFLANRFVLLHRPSSRAQEDRSFQCDRTSDSRVDRAADHRSVSRCHGSPLSTQRSRFDLWSGISKSSEGDAD